MNLLPFAVGVGAVIAYFTYVQYYRYHAFTDDYEPFRERISYVFRKVLWFRVIAIILGGGVLGMWLWYGLDSVV